MIKFLEDGDFSRACTNCFNMGVPEGQMPCKECQDMDKWVPIKRRSFPRIHRRMAGAIEEYLGNLPDAEETANGRKDTPRRWLSALDELTSGYGVLIPSIFKVFDDIPGDQMVFVGPVQFTSLCEHHILPFFGQAYIGYIPASTRAVGISKLARVFYAHARRLQVQERIGHDVVRDIMKYLQPSGAICVIKAQHLCMTSRGVKAEGCQTVTSAFEGSFKEQVVRQEFFQLAGI